MATGPDTEGDRGIARKLLVPVAISAAGSAVGFLLTKRKQVLAAAPKLREVVSDLPGPNVSGGGVGDLAGELRGKVESVLGKDSSTDGAESSRESTSEPIDRSQLEERRRARQERRDQRRRSRS